MKDNNYVEMIKFLESFLNYRNYVKEPLYFVYNWLTNVDSQEGESGGSWELQKGFIFFPKFRCQYGCVYVIRESIYVVHH